MYIYLLSSTVYMLCFVWTFFFFFFYNNALEL